ncbi:glycerol dehydratase reactivase beta/small subunit family protein [Trichococcus pasteurii]|uniref:Diol/glycerol dehydratase/dehydratase reactivating factor n=1 Tax=Trichococcus pasteurii TaxID=43064 RepID=A0A1W1IJM5_9LACT|nr:glycerol dehydratase reactivase beta/small subunit family protein [Trichococcus pasteurii]SFF09729.1 glycerol dehydratase reactivation factor, small subunit [Trichococcus pasteurii]SLM53197.1 diol/glycerol dehydratase/dehydratase reactivating factor [Trichococcus pasteurii]SSB94078.1 diol/glycerol dehydratase/dehydratase reactivating factor [Trichococcus pasteurii]
MKNNKYEKPSICIFCSSEIKDISNFSDLFFGIEEEGIPYEIKRKKESDASELSYRAAQESRLAVGIGIHKSGEIALTFNKLKKDEPLFSAHFNSGENILRNLGANAGRLVKGISFK